MQGLRITIVLMMFGGAAVAVAGVRIEQARCSCRIQQLKLRQIELCRTLNKQQLEIARLRSPAVVGSRIARMRLNVMAPEFLPEPNSDQPLDSLALADHSRSDHDKSQRKRLR